MSNPSFEQVGNMLKNHWRNRYRGKLKRKVASWAVQHLTVFWWVYAILIAVFLFFFLIAAAISTTSTMASNVFMSEKFLPPQIYVSKLDKAITSTLGERIHPVTKEKSFHSGIDIALPSGTPVSASQDGKVTIVSYPKLTDPEKYKECRYQRRS